MTLKKDRNFDNLIERFEQRIYDTAKGDWRLKLLREDLAEFYQARAPLMVWDAGCGLAQISMELAGQGHHMTLCDVSGKMLARAIQHFKEQDLEAVFHHLAAQDLAPRLPRFDLVLCHAVLEWLAEPVLTLQIIADRVKPGGHLSLLFYNRNAMVYTNALKGEWRWRNLLNDSYLGKGKRLTPPHPQYPHEIIEHLERWGFHITIHTGIRVFHDYVPRETRERSDPSELFELEQRYCRIPAYRDMGRYVHLLAQRVIAGPEDGLNINNTLA